MEVSNQQSQLSTAPASFWQSPLRAKDAVFAFTANAVLIFNLVFRHFFGPIFERVADGGFYLALASGDTTVQQPFASRQLGPLVVRGLSRWLHLSVQQGFLVEGSFCLLVVLLVVCWFAVKTGLPRWLALAMMLIPFWEQTLDWLVTPDVFYAALFGLFLVLLSKQRFLLAAAMMFPLMISRESTSLTVLCFLVAAWKPLRWSGRALVIAAAAAGMFAVKRLTAHSMGNAEHLSPNMYLLMKMPFNGLRVLGVLPWSNLTPMCEVPVWQRTVHLGGPLRGLHAIGSCGVSFLNAREVYSYAAMVFGLLPLLTAMLWWRNRKTPLNDPLLAFCLLYGGLCFVLAPLLGVWYPRLFGYAWPLFLVGLPLLASRYGGRLRNLGRAQGLALLTIHLALFSLRMSMDEMFVSLAVPVLYLAAYLLLKSAMAPGNCQPNSWLNALLTRKKARR